MIGIRRYTIRFSKAGYYQYAEFFEKKGKIINPKFHVSYVKSEEKPSIENLTSIDEILEVIKAFSYGNKAEIYLINGLPVNYFNNQLVKEKIKNFGNEYEKFLEEKTIIFFETVLEPIMKKNKWFISTSHIGIPVLIEKNSDGEWDNIKHDEKEFDFEYICYSFIRQFRETKIDLRGEHGSDNINGFRYFISILPMDYFIEKDLVVTI